MDEATAAGMALAAALMAANYPGDSGEDVERLIVELAKRGYRLASNADDDDILRAVSEARRDDYDRLRAIEAAARDVDNLAPVDPNDDRRWPADAVEALAALRAALEVPSDAR